MSGLLRRLAGRALGQPGATQLHAMARLPFQAAPAALVEAPAPLPAEPEPSASPQSPERQPSLRPAPGQPSPGRAIRQPPAAAATDHQFHDIAAPLPPLASPERPAPTAALSRPAKSRRSVPGMPTGALAASLPLPAAMRASPPLPSPGDAPAPSATGAESRPRLATDSAPPQDSFDMPQQRAALPEAMLPPAPAPVLAARHAWPAPAMRVADRQREPDEVHVHIGRVEITALPASEPTKRAKRKGQAPLSLDDYLARRKGDGP